MRLLLIGQSYGRGHSATAALFTDLAEGLASFGHDVHVLSSAADGSPASLERSSSVVVHRVTRRGSNDLARLPVVGSSLSLAWLWFCLLIWCFLTKKRFSHVVVLDTPYLITIAALVLRLRSGASVVAWVMDRPLLQIQALNRAGSIKSRLGWLLNSFQVFLFRSCTAVVVLGNCMLQRLCAEGVSSRRLSVIRTWDQDDLPVRAISSRQARITASLPDRFTVMYSGYAGVWHDFRPILAALDDLAYNDHLQFLFVGLGPGIDRVSEWCMHNPDANVIVRPYVPSSLRNQSLCCGDVHLVSLQPSMVGLCVPSKLNAALGLGRPVLVVAPPQCQSSIDVETSGAGSCVPTTTELTARINQLATDPKLYRSMSDQALAIYRSRHSKSQALTQWHALLLGI